MQLCEMGAASFSRLFVRVHETVFQTGSSWLNSVKLAKVDEPVYCSSRRETRKPSAVFSRISFQVSPSTGQKTKACRQAVELINTSNFRLFQSAAEVLPVRRACHISGRRLRCHATAKRVESN